MTNKEAIKILEIEQNKPRNIGCEMWVALDIAIETLQQTLRKGKWINGICSICCEPIPTDSARDALFLDDNKYCYNCGAYMREE